MKTKPSILLARIVKDAARLREDSYDDKKAAMFREQGRMDFESCYKLSKAQAVHRACAAVGESELAPIVHMLLTSNWNEALDWAESYTEADARAS